VLVDLELAGRDDPAGAVLVFAGPVESGADVSFPHPVEGHIRVTRSGETVWLSGEVGTTVTLTCGRCLRPFEYRLVGVFREGFRLPGESPPVKAGGDELVSMVEGPTLDVTEVVRQHLLVALPMVPLCRPACRGLCPVCGADRNETVCACVVEQVDPRLAPLRDFRPTSG
jgi:uncharacterized protein